LLKITGETISPPGFVAAKQGSAAWLGPRKHAMMETIAKA